MSDHAFSCWSTTRHLSHFFASAALKSKRKQRSKLPKTPSHRPTGDRTTFQASRAAIFATTITTSSLYIMLAQSQTFSTNFNDNVSEPVDIAYDGVPEVSGLILPATIECGDLLDDAPTCSGATVVSACSDEDLLLNPGAASPRSRIRKSSNKASTSSSSHSSSDSNDPITHPVPEFLCHLFTMLRDASIDHLISWEVPHEDEPDHLGGGIRGIGKIVVLDPESLQEDILGNYYRHSKYASFQRQLNYFGFKKRLHNGKKGKLSPCSYIHQGLTADVESLLGLKRRPPAKKRSSSDESDSIASSHGKKASRKSKSSKRRRTEKKSKRGDSSSSSNSSGDTAKVIVSNEPAYVRAEEYPPPPMKHEPQAPPAPTSLKELLSTALPPSDVLFNDEETSGYDYNGYLVTDNGMNYVHNVDNSLVRLAMFY